MNDQTAIQPANTTSLSTIIADRWAVPVDSMLEVVKRQLIQVDRALNRQATNAEIVVFLSIVKQYDLNPMLKQIHAWVDKDGRLCTMVGYDGFVDFALNPERKGKPLIPRYRYSDKEETVEVGYQDKRRKITSWEWIECWAEFEDGKTTDPIRCYFAEWATAKWKQPRNRHRMKAYCMMVREVRGFGVMDDTDFEKMQEAMPDEQTAVLTARGREALKERMRASQGYQEVAATVETEPTPATAQGVEGKEPSGTEPQQAEGAASVSGAETAAAAPEAEPQPKKRGRKPKPPAEPEPVAAVGADGVPGDPGCYFCGQTWDLESGDRYALPDGTKANRCQECRDKMEAAKAQFARGLPGSSGDLPPATEPEPEPEPGPDKWDSLKGADLLEAAGAVCSKSLKTVRELRRLSSLHQEDGIRALCRDVEGGRV